MSASQDWVRETRYSVNTGARIPNALYNRLRRFQLERGWNKTDIINAALEAFLPHYDDDQEGGSGK